MSNVSLSGIICQARRYSVGNSNAVCRRESFMVEGTCRKVVRHFLTKSGAEAEICECSLTGQVHSNQTVSPVKSPPDYT